MTPDVAPPEAPTAYRFGMPEVDAWASFSGDFNPIHFDAAAAQRFGQRRLVVHGMLATLRAKAAVWRRFDESRASRNGWARFRTLFRQPLPHGEAIELSMEPRRTLVFKLNAPSGGQEHFRGSCAELVGPEWCPDVEARGKPLAAARAIDFAVAYPDLGEPWIALDAIVFSQFMCGELDRITAMARQYFRGESSEVVAIVHSSHTVDIDTNFMSTHPDDFPWSDLTYDVMPPSFIPGDSRLICTIPLWIRAGQQHIMSVEIGVVVITHPSSIQDTQP